jgi:tetratricopeptide (TPR) repeat protein
MTLRRWMFAVLALSVLTGAARMWFLAKDRNRLALYHRQAITEGLTTCNTCFNALPHDLDFLGMYFGHTEPRRAWHARMAKKYELAAARPWLPVEPDPPPPDAEGRGFYWYERAEYSLALAAYEQAIRSNTANFSALNGLAWLLATCPVAKLRDGPRAVDLAERACALTLRKEALCIDTLAATRAEVGDFPAAVDLEREAIRMLAQGDPTLPQYRARLALYTANRPYHEPPNERE